MPLVPVEVHGPSKEVVPVYGLVDSGADCSSFPIELASRFGIELEECEHISANTAGGMATYFKWREPIPALVMGRQLKLTAVFNPAPIILLGREDFFSRFQVSFDQRKKRFRLDAY